MTYPGIENDPAAPTVNVDLLAVEELRRQRQVEYGRYVAVVDIPWGTVLAATPGMAVPTSTVERLRWDALGLVAKRTSTAGREVLERTGTATPEELETWAADDKATAEEQEAAADKAAAEKASGGEQAAATTAAAADTAPAPEPQPKPAAAAKNTRGGAR